MIDYASHYREQFARAGRHDRSPAYWDSRAESMSAGAFTSAYLTALVDRMDLDGCETLLDVGCGPGTVALTVAPRLRHVYGLDYSPGMLDAFARNAARLGIAHATALERSWAGDWSDVPTCDLVVASRAAAVPDLQSAIEKLAGRARRRVCLTYPVDGRFVGDEAMRIIGRTRAGLPDHVCALGVIHQLGWRPTLSYLDDANRFASCRSFESFVEKIEALVPDLTDGERDRLRPYFDSQGARLGLEPMRWAFIAWEVSGR